jgi:hypothetical protein
MMMAWAVPSIRRCVLDLAIGKRIEHILRMGVEPFSFPRFQTKLQNANSGILKLNCQSLAVLRKTGDRRNVP